MSGDDKDNQDKYDGANLSELFDNAFDLFNEINKTNESTNTPKIQSDVKRAMQMFEDATRLVSMVDMFSENETFNEVSTENMKYFLLPALLGTLMTKICNSDRMQIVDVAEIYFVDYLKRLKNYGLIDIDIPENKSEDGAQESSVERMKSNAEMITEMVNKRNTKIQRYREQKELESRLKSLKENMESQNTSEDEKREYFETLLKLYVNQALEELSSLAAEKPILEHMKAMGSKDGEQSPNRQKKKYQPAPLKPIIITKDSFQKQVYGAGYPSLPVLTVEEFYEKKIKDGDWPDPSQRNKINNTCLQNVGSGEVAANAQEEAEAEEMEKKVEEDDSETLARARAMDEYKDTHRRGWGNRANRS